MVIVHHPPTDAEGVAYYDLDLVRRNAVEILSGSAVWAPVGPLVRQQLAGLASRPSLDQGRLAQRRRDRPLGHAARAAHGRAGDDRPPQPARSAQMAGDPRGDPPGLPGPSALGGARSSGGGRFLQELVGLYPANWKVVPFGGEAPEQFLRSLDFFVYHHHPSWVEAFGCTIAEAMASGLPMLAAAACSSRCSRQARSTPRPRTSMRPSWLADDPAAYRRQSDAAQAFAQRHFSHETHRRRLRALIGPPSVPRPRHGRPRGRCGCCWSRPTASAWAT